MQKPKKPLIRFSMYWMYVIIFIALIGLLYVDDNSVTKEVSFSEFDKIVNTGGVSKIVVFAKRAKLKQCLLIPLPQRHSAPGIRQTQE